MPIVWSVIVPQCGPTKTNKQHRVSTASWQFHQKETQEKDRKWWHRSLLLAIYTSLMLLLTRRSDYIEHILTTMAVWCRETPCTLLGDILITNGSWGFGIRAIKAYRMPPWQATRTSNGNQTSELALVSGLDDSRLHRSRTIQTQQQYERHHKGANSSDISHALLGLG
jgi:hypothetical protein